MTRRPLVKWLAALAVAGLLAACSGPRTLPGDDAPTLATLATRSVKVEPDPPTASAARETQEQTIAAYRKFLQVAPQAPQRAEAMRRLGDLEMDSADRRSAEGGGETPDYRAAIARYEEFLKAYPRDPRTDRVLYQLARAQEQGGQLEAALATLTLLVQHHPGTLHAEEASFRRGELLFAMRDYRQAEAAYATLLAGPRRTLFSERALFMQGWSLFKQGRLEASLPPFFSVLDLKLGGLPYLAREEAELATIPARPGYTRADRELVEDTFRVVSIALSHLQGAESVARYMTSDVRLGYEFRVYQQLGELYLRQDRIKDAADAWATFVRRQPLHAQAPRLQARVIEIYQNSGFETLALQAKKDHVVRYGAASEFRRANPSGWAGAQPLVKAHLTDLARHHHARAQQGRATGSAGADVQEAVRWYRELLGAYPADGEAPQSRFLLAELLFEDHRFAEAALEYETVAYRSPQARRGADAGYAALLSYAALEKAAVDRAPLQRQAVDSSLRFAKTYPTDTRAGAVLSTAAEKRHALGDGEGAAAVARQALALRPEPTAAERRVAWTVIAHHAFERAAYADAELAYGEVLALTAEGTPGRPALVERVAAAIYRQGEMARAAGQPRDAARHFERIAALAALPGASAIRASALVDTAAVLMGLRDWDAAARTLETFRRQHAGHALQAEVAPKLALAYLELGRASLAAAEFEKVAASATEPALARGALWQAALLHQQVADKALPRSPALATAIKAWERYVQSHPQPLEAALDARWRLAALARQDGQAARAEAWTRAVQQADLEAGAERSARTRTLGGLATLVLAEPRLEAYKRVPLIEPLQKQLKLKKARMEEALQAYTAAAEVGVAEVTTAATFHTAALYQDFGRALIASQRPKKLNKAELEQYSVMLEEQAFPFEEKAIELHEANASRSAGGLYDTWVQRSFVELARMKPVRWGKAERGAAAPGTDSAVLSATLGAALAQNPRQPALLNQLGIAQRQQGQFAQARQSYEAAIALDPAAAAPHMNLAILLDLYLGDPVRAQTLYQRCLELAPADAATLNRWLAELKTRKPVPGAAHVASRKEKE